MKSTVPSVEIAHHADTHGIWCPDCKVNTGNAVDLHRVCTQNVVYIIMDSMVEFFCIFFCDHRSKTIGITYFLDLSVLHPYFHGITVCFLCLWNKRCKISLFISKLHGISVFTDHDHSTDRARIKELDHGIHASYMRTEQSVRIILLRIHNTFHICPVHQFV